MTITIKGVYRNGKIELTEKPPVPEGTEAVVTMQSQEAQRRPGQMYFGMFAKPGARDATWEDFQEARKMWEPKDLG